MMDNVGILCNIYHFEGDMEEGPTTARPEKLAFSFAIISVLVIALFAILDYSGHGAMWMGFGESSRTKETTNYDASETTVTSLSKVEDPQRAKTLWDWMQILVIPVAVTIGTFVLNQTAKRRDETLADQRAQDAGLQAYLDQMSELLKDPELASRLLNLDDKEGDNLRVLARARTFTVLGQLNAYRKRSVIQFLHEAGLIHWAGDPFLGKRPKLKRLDLRAVDLNELDLTRGPVIKLANFDLRGANLNHLDLRGDALNHVDLRGANLEYAYLNWANLEYADLRGASLHEANLTATNLDWAKLDGADLSGFRSRFTLKQKQLKRAEGDIHTILPEGFTRPAPWNRPPSMR